MISLPNEDLNRLYTVGELKPTRRVLDDLSSDLIIMSRSEDLRVLI